MEWNGLRLWLNSDNEKILSSGGSGEIVSVRGQDPLTAEALREFCRDQGLAGFKLPRVVAAHVGGNLPSNASGKVLKYVIRSELEALMTEKCPMSRL